jgi:transcriptional regulator with XRE-family HTH domain
MDRCTKCGSTDVDLKLLPEYQYEQFGISATLCYSVIRPFCNQCKHEVDIIPNGEGLDAALALVRILSPIKLNGDELRFIRKVMGLQAVAVAKLVEMSAESYSRLENGHNPISEKTEKLFRFNALIELQEKAPAIDVDMKAIMSMQLNPFREGQKPIELTAVVLKQASNKKEAWDKYTELKIA